MKVRRIVLGIIAAACSSRGVAAQDLLITNARILDGTGRVIDRGSVVMRGGKVASVAAGTATAPPGARVIDAQGRTVLPGFTDAHRHIVRGDGAQWLKEQAAPRMREFLEAGFTTVVSAGDQPEAILELRRRLAQGALAGPRVFAAGRVPLAQAAARGGPGGPPPGDPARFDVSRPPLRPTAPARAIPAADTIRAVEAVAKSGFDYIKTAIVVSPGGPEKETLALVVREGKKHDLPTITHAVSVLDTLAAVDAEPARLVHTPHIGRLEDDAAAVQTIAKAGIPMTSTLAIFLPHFDREGNTPLFRDGQPFPWNTISSAGQGPVNARLLWDAGITYGYGTDTSWHPRDSLADELRALQLTFSTRDIVAILTKNAAIAAIRGDQLGTLEPGKMGDAVILDGDPLANMTHLLNVHMVVKDGRVVVEGSRR